MFSNIGGLEVLFVLVIALIVLGPTKLPEAARQLGKFVNEARRISGNFQKEFREAVQDPITEAEARARGSIESTKIAVTEPFQAMKAPVEAFKPKSATPGDAPAPAAAEPGAADADPAGPSSDEQSGSGEPSPENGPLTQTDDD